MELTRLAGEFVQGESFSALSVEPLNGTRTIEALENFSAPLSVLSLLSR